MGKIIFLAFIAILAFFSPDVFAVDGTYEATVTTQDGEYKTTVEVEGDKIVYYNLPNGDTVEVNGAKIGNGEADGTDSDGKQVHIEIPNYNSFTEVVEDPDTEAPGAGKPSYWQ